ncbi:MAG: hypothetical protein AAFV53_27125 [Myxococcota bacterium]
MIAVHQTPEQIRLQLAEMIESYPMQTLELARSNGMDSPALEAFCEYLKSENDFDAMMNKRYPTIWGNRPAWTAPIQYMLIEFIDLLCINQGHKPLAVHDLLTLIVKRHQNAVWHYHTLEQLEEDEKYGQHWFRNDLADYGRQGALISEDLSPHSELAHWLKAWNQQGFEVIFRRDSTERMLLFIEVALGIAEVPYLEGDLPLLSLMEGGER